MADAHIGGRYQGRHRGRHRAPVPTLRERVERPGAGALAALGIAALVTTGGTRPDPEPAAASAHIPLYAAAASPDTPTSVDEQRASRSAQRAELALANRTAAAVGDAPVAVPTSAPPIATFAPVPPATTAKPVNPKPAVPPASGSAPSAVAGAACTGFEAAAAAIGLRGNAVPVYCAVRTTFGITNIGGYRAGAMDHGTGHAVDAMIGTNRALGDSVADYFIANASTYRIKYLIWRQRIWMPGSGTWRAMSDRGSVTANHYDHVHISVY